ncbi:hypothetical protein QYF61_024308 [Mycteria americana]|uniref:Endonuclease/exonuclease/phosphatase domain-containing protein n=1 Tax=Mycteria americana TaxID=33587 RepID=A0AAN7RK24_MYCAM|nr:hypothetical protein QYF61_024302 [Mycteria americana]KAK4807188.1 hypothetical protein QYF61_024308 [Mycteria americana]
MAGVYYRPPDQGEPIDEAFLLQLQEASHLQALILLGDFNHPDIHWKSGTASCKQSRRLLECIEDNFLIQVTESPTRGDALLGLLLTNAEELIGEVKIDGLLQKHKGEMHRQWKWGYASWEEYRDAAQMCRDGIKKDKAQLELNLEGL